MGNNTDRIHHSPADRFTFIWTMTTVSILALQTDLHLCGWSHQRQLSPHKQIHMAGDNDSIHHSPANKFIHIGGDNDSTHSPANRFTPVCNDTHNIHHSLANRFTFIDSFKKFQSVNSGRREKAVVLLCEKYIKQVSCTQCIPKAPWIHQLQLRNCHQVTQCWHTSDRNKQAVTENWTHQRSARIPLGPLHYYAGATHIPAIFILYAVLLQTNKAGHYHKPKKRKFKSVSSQFWQEKRKKGLAIFGSNYCKKTIFEGFVSFNYSNACISVLKWKLTITINIHRQMQTNDSGTKTKIFSKTNESDTVKIAVETLYQLLTAILWTLWTELKHTTKPSIKSQKPLANRFGL